jgi:hypothetical protein
MLQSCGKQSLPFWAYVASSSRRPGHDSTHFWVPIVITLHGNVIFAAVYFLQAAASMTGTNDWRMYVSLATACSRRATVFIHMNRETCHHHGTYTQLCAVQG